MSLHDLLDELEKAVSYVRRGASVNMATVDTAIANLRQHADAQLADLGHTAVTDAEQLAGETKTAAAPVIHDAETDAEQLGETAVADVQADLAAALPTPTTPPADSSTATPPADASTPTSSSASVPTDAADSSSPAAPTDPSASSVPSSSADPTIPPTA